MILHIPHRFTYFPNNMTFDCNIDTELDRMTDWHSDKLFTFVTLRTHLVHVYER